MRNNFSCSRAVVVRLVSPSDVTTTLLPLRVDDLTFPIALDAALGSFSVRDQVTPAVGWCLTLG